MDQPPERDHRIRELERRFRSAALPLLAEDYSATEDVFNRAIPLLAVVFVLEILGAINLDWPPALNVLALLGGVALVLVAFGMLNVSRGRVFFSVPQKLGVPELTAFVLLPVVLPLVFGGQLTSALVTGLGNLLLLGVIWLVVGVGMFSILRRLAARFVQLLGASLTLLVRALPLLLLLVRDVLHQRVLAAVRRGEQRDVLRRRRALRADHRDLPDRPAPGERPRPRARQLARGPAPPAPARERRAGDLPRAGTPDPVLGVAIWVFFMVFGALLVTPAIRVSWIGTPGHVLFTLPFFGEQLDITKQLVRTAPGVASFSALYYAVASAVDSTHRDEFIERLTQQLQEPFGERGEYLELIAARDRAVPVG